MVAIGHRKNNYWKLVFIYYWLPLVIRAYQVQACIKSNFRTLPIGYQGGWVAVCLLSDVFALTAAIYTQKELKNHTFFKRSHFFTGNKVRGIS